MSKATFVLTTVLVALGACGPKQKSHPPWASGDCNGAGCDNPGIGHGVVGDAGVRSGSDVDAHAVQDPDAQAVLDAGQDAGQHERSSIEVVPQLAVDLETVSPGALAAPVEVFELSRLSASTWEESSVGETNGEALQVSTSNTGTWFWFKLDPLSDWYSSVMQLALAPSEVTVPIFSKVLIDDLGAGLVNLPVVPDATMGHVVLHVVDDEGNGLPSVTAEVSAGVLAYGVGGTANDVQLQTGDTGTIVWFNAPIGGTRALTLQYQARSRTLTVPVLQASITMHTVTWNAEMP